MISFEAPRWPSHAASDWSERSRRIAASILLDWLERYATPVLGDAAATTDAVRHLRRRANAALSASNLAERSHEA